MKKSAGAALMVFFILAGVVCRRAQAQQQGHPFMQLYNEYRQACQGSALGQDIQNNFNELKAKPNLFPITPVARAFVRHDCPDFSVDSTQSCSAVAQCLDGVLNNYMESIKRNVALRLLALPMQALPDGSYQQDGQDLTQAVRRAA
ncbi:MAG: hypothetical protein KGL04_09900, partial [Elusimicrobia bacterium]|nr:hypothetical protein [Elusimicrobiota bacterium]